MAYCACSFDQNVAIFDNGIPQNFQILAFNHQQTIETYCSVPLVDREFQYDFSLEIKTKKNCKCINDISFLLSKTVTKKSEVLKSCCF